jgi:LysR family glycine cleavage system transcriptional activator/LysR family transcriptional regulator of beta-lactamase
MPFRNFDSLHVFDTVARRLSFTEAAAELNLTKGAVSYQIKRLEHELGFAVFHRRHRSIALTDRGKKLWHTSQVAFHDLRREINALQGQAENRITIGMSTYFASRWLSPRLMRFIAAHPRVGLRLQPQIDLSELERFDIDLAIRWGNGTWRDMEIEHLFTCPAFPTASVELAKRIATMDLQSALHTVALLHDRDNSTAWRDWYQAAGISYRTTRNDLVIPDPNVRVQAVIDGQGLALNDELVKEELRNGKLALISPVRLENYGYHLAYPENALDNPALRAFRNWIKSEAAKDAEHKSIVIESAQ